jgi:hypothetical protein
LQGPVRFDSRRERLGRVLIRQLRNGKLLLNIKNICLGRIVNELLDINMRLFGLMRDFSSWASF